MCSSLFLAHHGVQNDVGQGPGVHVLHHHPQLPGGEVKTYEPHDSIKLFEILRSSLLGEEDFPEVDEVLVGQLPHDLDLHEQVHLNQTGIVCLMDD